MSLPHLKPSGLPSTCKIKLTVLEVLHDLVTTLSIRLHTFLFLALEKKW